MIINSHESYISIEFNNYCKFNNIITITIPAHSSHLLQLLDIELFLFLKITYGYQINIFIQASINHIIKSEFFIVYLVAYNIIFIKKILKKFSEK